MRKNLLLLLTLFTVFAFSAKAQDITLAKFDDGALNSYSWGAPLSIAANPDMMYNASDSVALLDQAGGAWNAIAMWSDPPVLDSTITAIALDVYFKNTKGLIQFLGQASVSGAQDIALQNNVDTANVWVEVVFDVSGFDTLDFKQIAFQSSAADTLFVDNIRLLKTVPEDANNILKGGDMENAAAWNFYWGTNAVENYGTYEFNYTDDTPTGGNGGGYYVSASNRTASFLWQPVTLQPNHRYEISGLFKNVSADSITNTWVEVILRKTMPDGGEVSTGNVAADGEYMFSMNTWVGAERLNIDSSLKDGFDFAGDGNKGYFMLPEDAPTQWYFVIKVGQWTEGDYLPTTEVVFDEISLVDFGNTYKIENVIVGTVDSPEDFTATVDFSYDADSVYMVFDVVDDSIVNAGTSYIVDNFEVYFDMDNSKNVHYPRNGGWQANDPTYDTNDYQLRLVPGVEFSVNNSNFTEGYNQVYTETADGYQFILNIAWDALLLGFDVANDTLIGFDVLASDNDKDDSDGAYRNQITLNSRTDKAFNDPSLWGTFELIGGNSFLQIFDTENPAEPSNLVATDTVVTWDASTDNIAIYQYIISVGTANVDTIMALETGNTYTFKGLEVGTHTVGIVAVDNYDNQSSKATVDVIVEGTGPNAVNITEMTSFNVYPNPSNGIFNIVSEEANDVSIAVYNIAGQQIFTDVFNKNYTLNLTDAESGMYVVHLNNGEKVEVVNLIVR